MLSRVREPDSAMRTLIERVCLIPSTLRESGNRSVIDLVRDAGAAERAEALTSARLERFLIDNRPVIEEWLSYSENKRTSSGWYFREVEGVYLVGRYPEDAVIRFSDPVAACAAFILREIASIRDQAQRI